tara:strand:- start:20292 stop:20972 length:681 start_codon:yes stop_codon:yes gene_type:complete
MRNIILQHFDKFDNLRELDKKSQKNIQEYAVQIGADYELVLGMPFRKHLTAPCQKLYMIDEQYDDYDNVLMVDIDMFVPKNMNKDIFEEPGIGLYNPIQQRLHNKLVSQHPFQGSMDTPYWGGAIYKMDRKLRQKLRAGLGGNEGWMNAYNQPYQWEDEGIFHTLAFKTGVRISQDQMLHPKWCYDNYLEYPQYAGMIHIRTKITPQGPKQEKIKNYQALVDKGIL